MTQAKPSVFGKGWSQQDGPVPGSFYPHTPVNQRGEPTFVNGSQTQTYTMQIGHDRFRLNCPKLKWPEQSSPQKWRLPQLHRSHFYSPASGTESRRAIVLVQLHVVLIARKSARLGSA